MASSVVFLRSALRSVRSPGSSFEGWGFGIACLRDCRLISFQSPLRSILVAAAFVLESVWDVCVCVCVCAVLFRGGDL